MPKSLLVKPVVPSRELPTLAVRLVATDHVVLVMVMVPPEKV